MDMPVFNMSATQGGPHMGAKVINGVDSTLVVKNSYHFRPCVHHLASALG
jgi:hypothetical protein